jgi:hypothetical protein
MLLAALAYHHTITGEIVTTVVAISMLTYGVGIAIKNFARK